MEMDFLRRKALQALEERLGYTFSELSLLDAALTHTSYVKGDGKAHEHNERLEFLGDAVLELCVSEYLYRNFPKLNEGVMTRARAASVCESALHLGCAAIGAGDLPAPKPGGRTLRRPGKTFYLGGWGGGCDRSHLFRRRVGSS